MNTVEMKKSMTEVNRHAMAVESMDIHVDAFLSAEPQSDVKVEVPQGLHKELHDGINCSIRQEPSVEFDFKQEINQHVDIKEEPIPMMKQFAFIDANDQDVTCHVKNYGQTWLPPTESGAEESVDSSDIEDTTKIIKTDSDNHQKAVQSANKVSSETATCSICNKVLSEDDYLTHFKVIRYIFLMDLDSYVLL